MNKKKLSLILLLLAILLISLGLFAFNDLDIQNNLFFVGIVSGVAGMCLKIAAMLGNNKG
ncbi:MAG: hypothetical protein ACPF8V_05360 [Luteibaculum sp.]